MNFYIEGHNSLRPGQCAPELASQMRTELLVTLFNEQAAKLPQQEASAQTQF